MIHKELKKEKREKKKKSYGVAKHVYLGCVVLGRGTGLKKNLSLKAPSAFFVVYAESVQEISFVAFTSACFK